MHKNLEKNIDRRDGHWVWVGGTTQGGAPRTKIDGRTVVVRPYLLGVSRVTAIVTCEEPMCVNPDHLRAAKSTVASNEERRDPSALNWPSGEEYAELLKACKSVAIRYDVDDAEAIAQDMIVAYAGSEKLQGLGAKQVAWRLRYIPSDAKKRAKRMPCDSIDEMEGML